MNSAKSTLQRSVWAVVPVKETFLAKQRLATVLSRSLRQALAVAMFEDVMEALSASQGLAGIAVVTLDLKVAQIAARWGAEVWTEGAHEGHTGAVAAAAQRLARDCSPGLYLMPDLQYIIRPSAASTYPNAWVAGFRISAMF